MQTVEEALMKLKRSDFRARFHLSPKDIAYIDKNGMETVRRHCGDFIATRLAPAAAGGALKSGIVFPKAGR